MRPDRVKLLIATLLVAVTAAVFWRCLSADFVAWDDGINVVQNTHIQGLDAQHVAWMFTDTQAALRYKPLSWLGWAFIYSWRGLNPFGFHLANLVLHCLNTVLVFGLLCTLLSTRSGRDPTFGRNLSTFLVSGWGALIWALHPLRVEPVVWVTGFPYGLSLFFLLLSVLFYLESQNLSAASRSRTSYYWASVFSFLLASLSYPIGLTFPAVLLVIDLFRFSRSGSEEQAQVKAKSLSRTFLEILPFLTIAVLFIAVTFLGRLQAEGIWSKPKSIEEFGVFPRAMQCFYIWAYYAWKFWIPVDLSPFYTTLVAFDPLAPRFLLSALFVMAVTVLLFIKRRQWPSLLVLWMCHLALLIPMLGLTEHPHFPSDRYGVVVGILWSIGLAALLLRMLERTKNHFLVGAGASALVVTFGLLTFQQADVWQDSVSLFRHIVKSNPYHTLFLKSLAAACTEQKKYSEALDCYARVLQLTPDDVLAHERSASILFDLNRPAEAQEHYVEILRVQPQNAEHHNNLGVILAARGELSNAVAQFELALRIDPGFPGANRNMAKVLIQQGRADAAKSYLEKATAASARRAPPHAIPGH